MDQYKIILRLQQERVQHHDESAINSVYYVWVLINIAFFKALLGAWLSWSSSNTSWYPGALLPCPMFSVQSTHLNKARSFSVEGSCLCLGVSLSAWRGPCRCVQCLRLHSSSRRGGDMYASEGLNKRGELGTFRPFPNPKKLPRISIHEEPALFS